MTGIEQKSLDVEVRLERQASLQRILMETALHFINLPIDQLDQGIGEVLSHVGQFTQVDRTYLLEYDFVNALIHNTYEWCADWYAPKLAGGTDPAGPAKGLSRVLRGGGWGYDPPRCRSADRNKNDPTFSDFSGGFRVVLTVP